MLKTQYHCQSSVRNATHPQAPLAGRTEKDVDKKKGHNTTTPEHIHALCEPTRGQGSFSTRGSYCETLPSRFPWPSQGRTARTWSRRPRWRSSRIWRHRTCMRTVKPISKTLSPLPTQAVTDSIMNTLNFMSTAAREEIEEHVLLQQISRTRRPDVVSLQRRTTFLCFFSARSIQFWPVLAGSESSGLRPRVNWSEPFRVTSRDPTGQTLARAAL